MNSILAAAGAMRVIPVITIDDPSKAVPLAKAIFEAGITGIEITFRTETAPKAIAAITAALPDLIVGAGTVLTTAQVDEALAVGAKFLVSPGLNAEVVKYANAKNIPILPGVSSPSEIEAALALGLDTVKFFPAAQNGGCAAIHALAAPYSMLTFVPTGGITAENARDYLACDSVLAVGGSWLVPQSLLAANDFTGIAKLCAAAVALCKKTDAQTVDTVVLPAVSNAVRTPKKTGKVVTFGELMLRYAPPGYLRFLQAKQFQVTCGGAEANVAADLASLGLDATFVSKLPAHEIGQLVVNSLRELGVDTSYILRGGSRVGVYYCEKGASQRPSKVIYDRTDSAIAQAQPGEFPWAEIFADAAWFHFTGITPALSDSCAALCEEAVRAAHAAGVPVSCDINYRKNLWSREKAGSVMGRLLPFADVCIANEEDAADVFGIHAASSNINAGKLSKEGYAQVAQQLSARFGCKTVAITLRQSISASDNIWSAMLYTAGESYFSKEYPVRIVDRVGGGDSFGAGLIYAMLQEQNTQEQLEFAVAASCLKHSIEGDFNLVSEKEVRHLMGGDASGRVQR
jgi:2-dehydro-3-deoxygluconokinase